MTDLSAALQNTPTPQSAPVPQNTPAPPSAPTLQNTPDTPSLQRHAPLRKFWFDDVPPRESVAAERRYRQERLAVAFRLFARYGFDQGLAGHITARDPEWPAFYQDHALFDDFRGVVLDTDEGARIALALGERKAVILKNHGILTAGPSVEAAAWWYIALDNACHAQLLAEAAGSPQAIPHEVATLTHEQVGRPGGALFAFQSLLEGLVEAEPDVLS